MVEHRTSALGLLRIQGVSALLVAEIVSGLGSMMTALALPWFVLQTTQSAARTGFVLAAEVLPIVLLGIPSGTVAARLGARRTMLVCNLLWLPLLGLIPLLHSAGALSFPLLLIIVFCIGVLWTPYTAAQQTLLPELLGEDETAFGQANAFFQGAVRTTYWIGPMVAGVLIAALGAPAVLWVDASTFLVGFVLIALLVPPTQGRLDAQLPAEVLAGVRYLFSDRLLRPLTVSQVLSQASFQALILTIPVLAFTHFSRDATIAGILEGAWGAGALIGSLLALRLVRSINPLVLTPTAWLMQALPLWLLVARLPAFAIALTLFASGLGNGLRVPPMTALSVIRVPRALRSQAVAAGTTLAMLGGFLTLGLTGPALDSHGVTIVFAGLATVSTAAAILFTLAARRERSLQG